MTTPRDDIAGLSERLQRRAQSKYAPYNEATIMAEAATQLESLLKERDALQARVKEYDAAYDGLMKAKEAFRAEAHRNAERALRAEQERDEAYERAARVTEKEEPGWRGVCIAAEIRRLAAGPEKEKKE